MTRRVRLGAYVAAPNEHTLRPSVVSTLFPALPRRSRAPFRTGVALLAAVLLVLALLGWQAPLIAIGALGVPLLIALYLYRVDVPRDLPRPLLVLTVALGVALGVSWSTVSGAFVARSYDVALGSSEADPEVLLRGVAIPLGSAVLMLVPVLVVRLLRPAPRETLHGLVFGVLGAVSFVAAATLTRLAPQFQTGITADDLPTDVLVAEAGIQGIALPLTAAAVGGLVGIAVWFGRRNCVLAVSAVALAVSVAFGLLEVASWPAAVLLGLYLVIAAFALVCLRIGL